MTEEDSRFYVYVHMCKETKEVRYIGKGTGGRYRHKSNRTKEHRDFWELLEKKIIINNLPEEVAMDFEQRLLIDSLALGKTLFNVVTSKCEIKKIDHKELSEEFEYSEDSPSGLISRKNRMHGARMGEPVGFKCNGSKTGGYWKVKHKGKSLLVHRIIYALYYKIELDPKLVIDHIDSDRGNNKISNLQQISRTENNRKSLDTSKNKSGARGVSWHKNSETWVSYYCIDRKLQTKAFSPTVRYPELDYGVAKHLAFLDAVEYRNKMVALHYEL